MKLFEYFIPYISLKKIDFKLFSTLELFSSQICVHIQYHWEFLRPIYHVYLDSFLVYEQLHQVIMEYFLLINSPRM